MHPFLLALCVAGGVSGQLTNCAQPPGSPEFPPAGTRCDKAAVCGNYCARNHLSLDWLCCEDGNGWVAAHILNPLAFHLFWGDPVWTAFVVVLFEVFEATVLTFTGTFVIFETNVTELETWSGSLVGDALFQGGIGLALATLIGHLFAMPALVGPSHPPPGMAPSAFRRWRRQRIAAWVFHTALFILPTFTLSNDTVRIGLWINTLIQLLLIWGVYPWWLLNPASDPVTRRALPTLRPLAAGGFAVWGVVVLTLSASTAGGRYLANDWFQVWLTAAVLLTALLAAAVIAATRERRSGWSSRMGKPWFWLGLALVIVSFSMLMLGRAFAVFGVLVAAVVVLVLSVAWCVAGDLAFTAGAARSRKRQASLRAG